MYYFYLKPVKFIDGLFYIVSHLSITWNPIGQINAKSYGSFILADLR